MTYRYLTLKISPPVDQYRPEPGVNETDSRPNDHEHHGPQFKAGVVARLIYTLSGELELPHSTLDLHFVRLFTKVWIFHKLLYAASSSGVPHEHPMQQRENLSTTAAFGVIKMKGCG